MRILVCGGRDYSARETAYAVLDAVHAHTPVSLVIHGAARGADSLAAQWAEARGVPAKAYPAEWDKYGKGAGYRRNAQMLTESPDVLIALPGGRGTADMIRQATRAGVRVFTI